MRNMLRVDPIVLYIGCFSGKDTDKENNKNNKDNKEKKENKNEKYLDISNNCLLCIY